MSNEHLLTSPRMSVSAGHILGREASVSGDQWLSYGKPGTSAPEDESVKLSKHCTAKIRSSSADPNDGSLYTLGGKNNEGLTVSKFSCFLYSGGSRPAVCKNFLLPSQNWCRHPHAEVQMESSTWDQLTN
ncbi:hypothetical protein P7K49_010611 [Saguinus oedipus]|uniref:Uncharacterized protein n=1 Tax=Saguinus oedipus TaxID=9490 RepID=A0ABQ9VP37_SAGOE|nr:hypothetical protein P7K49_010611 [Saguinus oedipus]